MTRVSSSSIINVSGSWRILTIFLFLKVRLCHNCGIICGSMEDNISRDWIGSFCNRSLACMFYSNSNSWMNALFDFTSSSIICKNTFLHWQEKKGKKNKEKSFSKSILESDKSQRLKGYTAMSVQSNGSCGWQPSHVQMTLIRGEVGVGSWWCGDFSLPLCLCCVSDELDATSINTTTFFHEDKALFCTFLPFPLRILIEGVLRNAKARELDCFWNTRQTSS